MLLFASICTIAPKSLQPTRNLFDDAYGSELNTYLDFDGAKTFTVGVGIGLGVRDSESASFDSLVEALCWLDGAIGRALRP